MAKVLEEGEDKFEGEDVVLGGLGVLGGILDIPLVLGYKDVFIARTAGDGERSRKVRRGASLSGDRTGIRGGVGVLWVEGFPDVSGR